MTDVMLCPVCLAPLYHVEWDLTAAVMATAPDALTNAVYIAAPDVGGAIEQLVRHAHAYRMGEIDRGLAVAVKTHRCHRRVRWAWWKMRHARAIMRAAAR